MNAHLWWVRAHYSPQLVERWTCVSSPLLPHTTHRRRTDGSRGATQRGVRLDLGGVSQLTLWRQEGTLVRFIFIFYFVRLPLCNNYPDDIVTFISIHCYYMCCLLWRIYEMHPTLSLKSGCDSNWVKLGSFLGFNFCWNFRKAQFTHPPPLGHRDPFTVEQEVGKGWPQKLAARQWGLMTVSNYHSPTIQSCSARPRVSPRERDEAPRPDVETPPMVNAWINGGGSFSTCSNLSRQSCSSLYALV
jgi:hypothetical protein